MPPYAGMRFGRYELLDKVGAGGMGEVYRARDLDLGRVVAVKFLPERLASIPDRLGRFAQEARAASSLNHPNIVTIHEIGEAAGMPFTVMELVDGETLRQMLLTRSALSTRRVLEIASQLAEGLARAHAAGITHRDLKPENVMVTRDGYVKILDFGLAKLRGEGAQSPRSQSDGVSQLPTWPDAHETAAGVLMGTVKYMSPEQAGGRPADHRSDQFALGAMLYEMMSGRPPFERETTVQTLAAIIEDEPDSLATTSPTTPGPARWIVERCLAKEPGERYASTQDLAHELRGLRERLPEMSASSASVFPRPAPVWRWTSWRLTVAAAAVALVSTVVAREPIRRFVEGWDALPAQRHVAVLPFELTSPDPEDRFRSDGLAETLTARLSQLEPYHAALSVVPAHDVREAGVTTADKARRTFGATLVVAAQLRRLGDRLRFDAQLVDTRGDRVLRRLRLRDQAADALSLQEGVIEAVAGLLEVPIGDGERRLLRQGSTVVAGAYALYLQARGHLQRFERADNLERAISILQKALEQDPSYALAYSALGEAYWRLYELDKRPNLVGLAQENCRRALELNDLLAPVHVTLGMIHRGTGAHAEALADLRRALDRDPRSAEAYREIGRTQRALRRNEEAEAAFRKAAELRPSDWAARNYLGALLIAENRPAEAEIEFQRVIALAPDNPRGYTNLGAVSFHEGKLEQAESSFRRSIEIRPTAAALSNWGTVLFYLGRFEEAAHAFEQAARQNDRDADAWLNLGRAYYEAPGMREKARQPLERAVALGGEQLAVNPRDASMLVGLADAHAMLGHRRQASQLVARALELAPHDADVLVVGASVDEELGRREAALEKIARALAAGYARWEIEKDPALAELRKDPRFARALGQEAPADPPTKPQ